MDDLIEQGKAGAARGLLGRARILFNYAVQQELDVVDASPVLPVNNVVALRTEPEKKNEKKPFLASGIIDWRPYTFKAETLRDIKN